MLGDSTTDESSSLSCKLSQKMVENLPKIRSILTSALSELRKEEEGQQKSLNWETNATDASIRNSLNPSELRSSESVLSLQKGYIMTKHSGNASPHSKYVYLSSDQRDLCWKSLDKSDEKRIELKKIDVVLRGEEAIGTVRSASIQSLEKVVVVRSSVRNLELEAIDHEESLKFQLEMQEVTKRAKSLHLSYKF